MPKKYYAIVNGGAMELSGAFRTREDADKYAVDALNIHQAGTYLILDQYEVQGILFDLNQMVEA